MSCIFRPARLTHVGPIATNMREMDRLECTALGRSPKNALRNGLVCSQEAWTALKDGQPHAMMGVVSDGLLSRSARVWFLGTDEVYSHARDLLMYGPLFVDRWLTFFDELHNIVAAENVKAIRLLKAWGFEVNEGQPSRWGGVNFVTFRIKKGETEVSPVVQSVTSTFSMVKDASLSSSA